jgi:hypothetical protein
MPIQPSPEDDASSGARHAPRDLAPAPLPTGPCPAVHGGPRAPTAQRQGASSSRPADGWRARCESSTARGGRARQAWRADLALARVVYVHGGAGLQVADDSRDRGVRPVVLTRRIVPTGEPCKTETVLHGLVGGRGNRSKLPRPQPSQSRASRPLPAVGELRRSARKSRSDGKAACLCCDSIGLSFKGGTAM